MISLRQGSVLLCRKGMRVLVVVWALETFSQATVATHTAVYV